jgi:uncharacterized protein
MNGEKNLAILLKTMKPTLNVGEFVFSTVKNLDNINIGEVEMVLKEKEGITIIAKKAYADSCNLEYTFIAAWITLTVHSALDAVGLTAAFSKALAAENISCNVVAGYFHDHLFVDKKDANQAIKILQNFSL